MRRLLFLALIFALSLGSTSAHPLLQDSMWVVVGADRVRVAVNASVREIAVTHDVKDNTPIPNDRGDWEPMARGYGEYLATHLWVRADGVDLPGKFLKLTQPASLTNGPEETIYQFEFEYPLLSGSRPERIALQHKVLSEYPYAPGQSWDVTYVMRIKRDDRPEVAAGLLRAGVVQEFSLEEMKPVTEHATGSFLTHGIMHILTGYDHLLFVSALVLATVSFWEMFKVIGAFTLAHTITLAVSTLTGFKLPDYVVEPVISASIVFVAVGNLVWPRHSQGWVRLLVAFGFGLVHGLGFAGGLRDAMSGLGTSALVTALIAFSLGVEIGHQVVVLPLFGLLKIGDLKFSTSFRQMTLRYGSIAISLAGVYYLINALTSA